MNEPPQDVLLDSSAYFRLAQSIRPLLQTTFGASPAYSLHVLVELDDEYATSNRLQHKFEWVSGKEFPEDRLLKRHQLHGEARTQALGWQWTEGACAGFPAQCRRNSTAFGMGCAG